MAYDHRKTKEECMTDGKQRQPKYSQGARVRIASAEPDASGISKKHQGKTGYVTKCKPTEHPVVFLYDVVMDADESTLELLPESCLESE